MNKKQLIKGRMLEHISIKKPALSKYGKIIQSMEERYRQKRKSNSL
jgi:hypothetical protein